MQQLAACEPVSASIQSLRLILRARLYSSFITSGPESVFGSFPCGTIVSTLSEIVMIVAFACANLHIFNERIQ